MDNIPQRHKYSSTLLVILQTLSLVHCQATQYGQEGGRIRLVCPLSPPDTNGRTTWNGPPSLKVYFINENKNPNVARADRLSVVRNTNSGGYDLQITGLSRGEDVGEYLCTVNTNPLKQHRVNLNLYLHGEGIEYGQEGGSIRLVCPLSPPGTNGRTTWNGPPSLSAYFINENKNPNVAREDRLSVVRNTNTGGYDLQITGLSRGEDVGEYSCSVNTNPPKQHRVNLNMYLLGEGIQYGQEGGSIRLVCPLSPPDTNGRTTWDGPPSLTAYFINENKNPNVARADRLSVVRNINSGGYDLQITGLSRGEDVGEYLCSVNTNPPKQHRVNLNLYLHGEEIQYGQEGGKIRLVCPLFPPGTNGRTTWNGPPSSEAYFINENKNPNVARLERLSVVRNTNTGGYDLQITGLSRGEDVGQYSCSVNTNPPKQHIVNLIFLS